MDKDTFISWILTLNFFIFLLIFPIGGKFRLFSDVEGAILGLLLLLGFISLISYVNLIIKKTKEEDFRNAIKNWIRISIIYDISLVIFLFLVFFEITLYAIVALPYLFGFIVISNLTGFLLILFKKSIPDIKISLIISMIMGFVAFILTVIRYRILGGYRSVTALFRIDRFMVGYLRFVVIIFIFCIISIIVSNYLKRFFKSKKLALSLSLVFFLVALLPITMDNLFPQKIFKTVQLMNIAKTSFFIIFALSLIFYFVYRKL